MATPTRERTCNLEERQRRLILPLYLFHIVIRQVACILQKFWTKFLCELRIRPRMR
jgi:hypothetical protein